MYVVLRSHAVDLPQSTQRIASFVRCAIPCGRLRLVMPQVVERRAATAEEPEIAAVIGPTERALHINGHKEIGIRALEKIARALDVSLPQFFEGF